MLLIILYILFIKPAYAYVDPGTASIVISSLIGIIVTTGLYIRKYYEKIKFFLKKIFKFNTKVK